MHTGRHPGLNVVLLAIDTLLAAGVGAQDGAPQRTLREVRVNTRDVFSAAAAEENLFYWLANGLHATTHDEVVLREVWPREGDPIDLDLAGEIERNLRGTSWFGDVATRLVPIGDDRADLVVDTRDRFSLLFGASASFFGGVRKINAALSESNLFGTGKRISAQYRESEDERRGQLRFTDPQFLGSWHRLDVAAGETEEGAIASLGLTRPFKHLGDPLSYGLTAGFREQEIDYFLRGDSIAQVPEERGDGRLFVATARGPRRSRDVLGAELVWRASAYDAATGTGAAGIRVPGDTTELRAGPFFGFERIRGWRQVVGLDTLDFTEDLELGVRTEVGLAAVHYDSAGTPQELQARARLHLRAANALGRHTFVTGEVDAAARFDAHLRGWHTSVALHVFDMSLPAQTLAGSLTFQAAEEHQGLVPQLTLGEDNGLRGYPAREFAGRRLARVNLEDRIRTPVQLLSVHLGLAAFVDVAWIHGPEQDLSMRDGIAAAGFGLRFGSSHLSGDGMFRVDVAWPLTRIDGEGFGVSVSASPGQAFTFFGNQSQLLAEFGP